MVFPPYAAPFPDSHHHAHRLGAQHRAALTLLAQKPGHVVTREELAAKLGLPKLTPRRSAVLIEGINAVLGPDAVTDVSRRGWKLNHYTHAPG